MRIAIAEPPQVELPPGNWFAAVHKRHATVYALFHTREPAESYCDCATHDDLKVVMVVIP